MFVYTNFDRNLAPKNIEASCTLVLAGVYNPGDLYTRIHSTLSHGIYSFKLLSPPTLLRWAPRQYILATSINIHLPFQTRAGSQPFLVL